MLTERDSLGPQLVRKPSSDVTSQEGFGVAADAWRWCAFSGRTGGVRLFEIWVGN